MYGPTSSPHAQVYNAPGLEYRSQIPIMPPRVMYERTLHHRYPQNIRSARRSGTNESPTGLLRSPLLEEFRGSKGRKWELKVYKYSNC